MKKNCKDLKEHIVYNLVKTVSFKENIVGESFDGSDSLMIKVDKDLVDMTK